MVLKVAIIVLLVFCIGCAIATFVAGKPMGTLTFALLAASQVVNFLSLP